ncbi:hypothetical protein HWV62_38484 [Athelia sp. TMB]|nr:hypothetical protein HWV62_38484 [Athelia sp. TMB]
MADSSTLKNLEVELAPPLPSPRCSTRSEGEKSVYALTVMADLHRNYHLSSDQDHSLNDRVVSFLSRQSLTPMDIIDRGIDVRDLGRPPYTLKKDLLDAAEDVVSSMQTTLDTAFDMLESGSEEAYAVDPRGIMLQRLKGSKSFYDIERAYDILLGRVGRAQAVFMRYISVYRDGVELRSPSWTDPAVYEPFKAESLGFDQAVDALYGGVPTLNRRLDERAKNRLRAGESLRQIIPSPLHLKSAFSPRMPEENPIERYYNNNGARINNRPPSFALEEEREVDIQQVEPRHARIADPPITPATSDPSHRWEDSASSYRHTWAPRSGSYSAPAENSTYYSLPTVLETTFCELAGSPVFGLFSSN